MGGKGDRLKGGQGDRWGGQGDRWGRQIDGGTGGRW